MGKIKQIRKEIESKTPPTSKVVTEKIGGLDVGIGLKPGENKDPFLFIGKRSEDDSNYGYLRAGPKGDKQIGFGKSSERGSVGIDVGKNFVGIGGEFKFKKGGIARGCGKVLEDRRKVTKYY